MGRQTIRDQIQTIDREFPEIGRIRVRKKMPKQVRDDYNAMLTALYRQGRHDVLVALRDKVFPLEQLYAAFASSGLAKLPTAEALVELTPAWDTWLARLWAMPPQLRQSAEHLRMHKYMGRKLTALVGVGGSLRDIPRALETARKQLVHKPRTFNKLHASASAFLRDTLRASHPLYKLMADYTQLDTGRKRKPNPQTVAQLVALEAVLSPQIMTALWSMATTGMIPREYWVDGWEVALGGLALHIHGGKREARDRVIPSLGRCAASGVGHDYVRRQLHLLTNGATLAKDMRNTFMTWMSEAGIPRARRMIYMGHTVGDISALYEHQEVLDYIRQDRERFVAWLAAEEHVARGGVAPPLLALAK